MSATAPARAVTNQEFGDRVGCHHSMASRLRSGKRLPGVDMMVRISEEFAIPIKELVHARQQGREAMGELLRKRAFKSDD